MELGNTRALIMMLRELNVTYYKDSELELKLGPAPATEAPGEEDSREEITNTVDDALKDLAPGYRKLFTVEAS